MSDTTRRYVDMFWELIDEILNAVLFVLIGMEVLLVDLLRAGCWLPARRPIVVTLLAAAADRRAAGGSAAASASGCPPAPGGC